MVIVFDTNIWISELGLNSTVGSAIKFYAKWKNAKIALPEVVRLETETHLRESLNGFIKKVNDNYKQLLIIFGTLKEVVLPSSEQVENKIQGFFADLGVELIEIPFGLEGARNSFLKTINKEPPSDRAQEFKDGVLWADCVKLLDDDDVYFVSNDSAFFRERKFEMGLANNLEEESTKLKHKLKIFSSLKGLLNEIKTEIVIDENILIDSFRKLNRENIDNILANNKFGIINIINVQKTLFVTEKPNVLYIDYAIDFRCSDLTEENRNDAVLKIHGDGRYNIDTGSFEELRPFSLDLIYHLPDGTEKVSHSYSLRVANIIIGHKEISYSVMYKVE